MAFDLAICGGLVVSSTEARVADVLISGGVIEEVGELGGRAATQVIDATGYHVLPGFIDTQVHFREPGLAHKEDLESGTRAAICGGVTTIFEMPNTSPPTTTAEALADKLERCKGRAWCDFAFFVGASRENIDRLPELEMLPGTPGVKIFVGSSTGTLLVEDDETLEAVLRAGVRPSSIHAEDEPRLRERKELFLPDFGAGQHCWLRDAEAARLATERVISLSEKTGRPVHILHISTGDEVPIIAAAKARGAKVTAEVTPQHLIFSAPEAYSRLGALVQMNPPVREEYHRQALWRSLSEDVFDVFGSDHAPHTLEEKSRVYSAGHDGSPSGMPGVQTLLPAILAQVLVGKIDLSTAVKMGSERPAELFGIKGKGHVKAGFDADLAIVKLDKPEVFRREQVQSKCGWSPYEGMELAKLPRWVVLRGQIASENGLPTGSPVGQATRFAWKP